MKLAVPGSKNMVTIKTPDLRDHVDIFYKRGHYQLPTKDILRINSLSDVLTKIKTIRTN